MADPAVCIQDLSELGKTEFPDVAALCRAFFSVYKLPSV